MMKRVIALVLCLATILLCLAACGERDANDKGAYIRMYLSEPVYDFDPLNAYTNEAALQVISLLYEPLFFADKNGEPQKALVEDYDYTEDEEEEEYIMTLKLKETTWSDGVSLTSTHVQFSFNRLLQAGTSHPAAALLYDIKNARAIVSGETSIDHLGVSSVDNTTIEIKFEHPIDEDAFLLNLCSPALIPLRDDIIASYPDAWNKKSTNLVCSGPFMLRSNAYPDADGFILERNSYYYRDREKDAIDKYVTPYRIIVDYTKPVTEQLASFDTGAAGGYYYFGDIAIEARKDAGIAEQVEVSDAPSTHVYYFNYDAKINGEKIFAKKEVRQALSMAIDRDTIVDTLVYARAADGMVPYTLRNRADKKDQFREVAASYIASKADTAAASALLAEAGIDPSRYSFSITVASYDTDHMAIAAIVEAAWDTLGFDVSINALTPVERVVKEEGETVYTGIYDNPYQDAIDDLVYTNENGREQVVEVIALDLVSVGIDAFSYLAPFAAAFSGNEFDTNTATNPDGLHTPHISGYNCPDYNAKIEAAYTAESQKDRAALLHEAEQILIYDMAAIPIVYNQNVALQGKNLKGVEQGFFCNAFFTEASLKNYWQLALDEGLAEPAPIEPTTPEKKDD